jgi:hypothetical protein
MARVGRVELQLWRDGQPITRSFLAEHQTHIAWHRYHHLPPDGVNLPQYCLVEVKLRSLMPLGTDWYLIQVHTEVNQNYLGQLTTALRFATDPDPWPTAVQPLIVPLFKGDRSDGFETWYLTIRGDGSEEVG